MSGVYVFFGEDFLVIGDISLKKFLGSWDSICFRKNKKPEVFESSILLHLEFHVVSIAKNTTKCLKPHAVAESPQVVADYVESLLHST